MAASAPFPVEILVVGVRAIRPGGGTQALPYPYKVKSLAPDARARIRCTRDDAPPSETTLVLNVGPGRLRLLVELKHKGFIRPRETFGYCELDVAALVAEERPRFRWHRVLGEAGIRGELLARVTPQRSAADLQMLDLRRRDLVTRVCTESSRLRTSSHRLSIGLMGTLLPLSATSISEDNEEPPLSPNSRRKSRSPSPLRGSVVGKRSEEEFERVAVPQPQPQLQQPTVVRASATLDQRQPLSVLPTRAPASGLRVSGGAVSPTPPPLMSPSFSPPSLTVSAEVPCRAAACTAGIRPIALSENSERNIRIQSKETELHRRVISGVRPPDNVDFTERFYRLSECIRRVLPNKETSNADRLLVNNGIIRLYKDFLYCAKTFEHPHPPARILIGFPRYGRIIIAERHLHVYEKTIRPKEDIGGVAGGEKFVVSNILFKFAHDDKNLYGGDEAAAAKVAGHELKSLVAIYNCHLPIGLPLVALVDYRGQRVIAESYLPITSDTLVLGSADSGTTVHEGNANAQRLMAKLALNLNVREHRCAAGANIYTCTDMEGHEGPDGRFYLLDFSRTFPPEGPPRQDSKRSYLFRLLRPEFVKSYRKPLCSDAFSQFVASDQRSEMNADVEEASRYLFQVVIPKFSVLLVDKVCNSTTRGVIESLDLKFELHSKGINLRHLGKVLACVGRDSAYPEYMHNSVRNTCALLMIEMVARSFRQLLYSRLREAAADLRQPMDARYLSIYVEFLRMLSTKTPDQGFWQRVHTHIQEKFEVVLQLLTDRPFLGQVTAIRQDCDTEGQTSLGRNILLMKILKLTGCKLKKRILVFLQSNKSIEVFDMTLSKLSQTDIRVRSPAELWLIISWLILIIQHVGERVKDMNIVNLAEGYVLSLSAARSADPAYTKVCALKKFEKALAGNPNNSVTLRKIAQLHVECNLHMAFKSSFRNLALPGIYQAYECYNEAVDTDPKNTESLFQHAEFIFNFIGLEDDVFEDLIRVLQIAPGHVKALELLLRICTVLHYDLEADHARTRIQQLKRNAF
eukprot:m51a1_g3733 hypothetical protein (1030) ;mRNA; f:31267-34919